jgi:hypothetical protein
MFKSIEFKESEFIYGIATYVITDDDFIVEYTTDDTKPSINIVMDFYEKKNLNVAANVALCFRFFEKTGFNSKRELIALKANKKYKQYYEDIIKYLSLV